MRCDTCGNESLVIQRVVIAKGYNRSLARALYNCPACYEKKEQSKSRSGFGVQGSGQLPTAPTPEPTAKQGGST